MNRQLNRRQMLRVTAGAAAGYWVAVGTDAARGQSANDKLNVAFIGVGGRGRANLEGIAREGENVVALCDVDDQRAGDAFEKYPRAKKFYDFRRMFDALEQQIDAVVVSTPDHTHFRPARMALERGMHLYCEKPMAHSVAEVRALTDLAARRQVATQLGVQRHTLENVHRVVEIVRSGVLGEIRECHSWVGGDRGMPELPTEFPSVPAHLKWDLWLGPARDRPYSGAYVPYKWRFWWDFGTGETGNWGCHILDLPYWALELQYPTSVEAAGPPVHPQTTPRSMTTRFEFPATDRRPAVTLHWSHTRQGPPVLRERGLPQLGSGTLFVGSEGMLLCDFSQRRLYPREKFDDYRGPERQIADSPGFYREWTQACRGGPPATCNFEYSGPLTETVLLGNVAYRAGGGFTWNAATLEPAGNPQAAALLRSEYRDGWQL